MGRDIFHRAETQPLTPHCLCSGIEKTQLGYGFNISVRSELHGQGFERIPLHSVRDTDLEQDIVHAIQQDGNLRIMDPQRI